MVLTKSEKNKKVTLLMAIFLGYFGGHYFYVGRIFMGLLYFFTHGLFLIGWFYDIYRIIVGKFPDHNGQFVEGFDISGLNRDSTSQSKYRWRDRSAAAGSQDSDNGAGRYTSQPNDIYVDATVIEPETPKPESEYTGAYTYEPQTSSAPREETLGQRIKKKTRQLRDQIFTRQTAIIVAVVLMSTVLVAALAYSIKHSMIEKQNRESYQEAIADIQDLNFGDAKRELEGLEIEDSRALQSYCEIQMNLTSYRGKPRELSEDLKNIGELKDRGVKAQYQNALAEVDKAIALQDEIDQAESDHTVDFSKSEKEREKEIEKKLSEIDVRYRVLVEYGIV